MLQNQLSLCEKTFSNKSNFEKHKKTKKHIINTVNIKGDNNIVNISNVENLIINFYNPPIYAFKNTNIDFLTFSDFAYIVRKYESQIDTIAGEVVGETAPITHSKVFMKCLIKIFKKLNFNISNPENNNCRLLLFINTQVESIKVTKYLVLEIKENNEYVWMEITYDTFIIELLSLMNRVKEKFNYEKFNYIMNYLDTKFKDNQKDMKKAKEYIERKLDLLANKFKHDSGNHVPEELAKYVKNETKVNGGAESSVVFIEN